MNVRRKSADLIALRPICSPPSAADCRPFHGKVRWFRQTPPPARIDGQRGWAQDAEQRNHRDRL